MKKEEVNIIQEFFFPQTKTTFCFSLESALDTRIKKKKLLCNINYRICLFGIVIRNFNNQ